MKSLWLVWQRKFVVSNQRTKNLLKANAGDSRAVISVAGKVKPLSYDHKPTDEAEMERIINAGGFVEFGRVNGNLALSRAIGDFEFKQSENLPAEKQVVTCKLVYLCLPYDTLIIAVS